MNKIVLCLILLLSLQGLLFAQYSGGAGPGDNFNLLANQHLDNWFKTPGNWSEAENWSQNTVPVPSERAWIKASVEVDGNYQHTDLIIEADGKVTIPVTGALTITGILINNASSQGLVIKSDITGSGSLIHATDNVSATVERYITGNSWNWHFLSSPVADQEISGDFTPSGENGDYDFYSWYEPELTWVNFKNTTVEPTWFTANGSNQFEVGKGYLVAYEISNTIKTFTGALNQGSVNFPLSALGSGQHQQYNHVGNPFPSSIDWKSGSGWNLSGLEPNGEGYDMHIWNDIIGNYGAFNSASLNDGGTNNVSRYIAPMQGFMVKADNAKSGNLTMDNAIRVHSSQAFLKSTEELADYLKLKVTGTPNTYSDEVIIEFNHDSDQGGASKLLSFVAEAPGLCTMKDGSKYAIDFRSSPKEETTIPLHFRVGANGNYTIQALTLETFTQGVVIALEDRKTGIMHELTHSNAYTFNAMKEDNPDRFLLHFTGAFGVNELNTNDVIGIYSHGQSIYISSIESAEALISVFNITGQQVYNQQLVLDGLKQITLNVPAGCYVVQAVTSGSAVSRKVFIR
ncbi:MAG: T9SS type A sorting domain-containing protein [Bacteroidales bacterium]|nr:T9SS type A sorting domain-containing protein [Bacteroidales bacterium]